VERQPGASLRGGSLSWRHAIVAFLGVGLIVWAAVPVRYDGLLHFDLFPIAVLSVVFALSPLFGYIEGAAVRGQWRVASRVVLIGFAMFAFAGSFVIVGKWRTDDFSANPSSDVDLAMLGWLLSNAVEFVVARRVARDQR
jgi:hypothetical protein